MGDGRKERLRPFTSNFELPQHSNNSSPTPFCVRAAAEVPLGRVSSHFLQKPHCSPS